MSLKSLSVRLGLMAGAFIVATGFAAGQTGEFIFVGNSVSFGTDATSVNSPVVSSSNTNAEGVALAQLGSSWYGLDLAVPGADTAETIASWSSNNDNNIWLPGVTKKVVVLWAASNEFADYTNSSSTLTPAQLEAEAQSVYNATVSFSKSLQAQGDLVLALTVLPRDEPSLANPAEQEALRQDFNSLVIAGWSSWANAVVDVGDAPHIGQLSDVTNFTYYTDGSGDDVSLHLTNLGYQIVGDDVAGAIETLEAPEPSTDALLLGSLGLLVLTGPFLRKRVRASVNS